MHGEHAAPVPVPRPEMINNACMYHLLHPSPAAHFPLMKSLGIIIIIMIMIMIPQASFPGLGRR